MTFYFVPEWQGSRSPRALSLLDGAAALRKMLPSRGTVEIEVETTAGDALGTAARRLSSVLRTRDALLQQLRSNSGSSFFTLGGDAATSLAPLQHALETHADSLRVLWLSHHRGLDDPAVSPTGAIDDMTLAAALGHSVADLAFATPLQPEQVALLGTDERDEQREISEDITRGVRVLDPGEVPRWLDDSGATAPQLYLHIDLTVLDPKEFQSVATAVPSGFTVAELAAFIRSLHDTAAIIGATVSGFQPPSQAGADITEVANDDAGALLPLLGALTSPPKPH